MSESAGATEPTIDRVARVLNFRRVRWVYLGLYIFFIPILLAYWNPFAFIFGFPVTAIAGLILFVRRGRYRLPPAHFAGGEIFATMIGALAQTKGTQLYLRERYSRDAGERDGLQLWVRQSSSGLRSETPFLVAKSAQNRLYLTPQQYWLQMRGNVITGPTASIGLETFDLEEKVARPRDDDQVLGSTWLYATKRGDRDLRFNDNREFWLVRRHAVELAFANYRWAICLYGLPNARQFVSAFAEITNQPIEIEYHPDDEDADEQPEQNARPAMPRTWYEVLGVAPQATVGEIKDAYRRLLMQYHPDRVATLGEKLRVVANEEAGEIIKAYKAGLSARGGS